MVYSNYISYNILAFLVLLATVVGNPSSNDFTMTNRTSEDFYSVIYYIN